MPPRPQRIVPFPSGDIGVVWDDGHESYYDPHALRDSPQSKDRWYLYRAERLHELIDEWLEQNAVIATDPPPWS